jgi:hypothetical protein
MAPAVTAPARVVEPPYGEGEIARVEAYALALAIKDQRLGTHQILRPDPGLVRQTETPQGNLEFRFDRPPGIEADGNQQRIAPVRSGLRIIKHRVVEGIEELEAQMAVQRRIGAADLVQPADLGLDIAGSVPVPGADLVFLGIDVLLPPSQCAGLAKLEAVVHPPEPRERACERRADQERRPSAGLEKEGIDVRRVDEEMRAEEIRHRLFGKLREIRGELIFGVAPCEIRVRLREPDLRQPVHHRRPRERFSKKDHVRVVRADILD